MNPKELIENSLQKIKDLYAHVAEIKKDPEQPMLIDAKGRHCPINIINDIDLARNRLVNERIQKALALSAAIAVFKKESFFNIDDFVMVSNESHGGKIGVVAKGSKRQTWKGNIQLINYDGTQKICLKIADKIAFNEKLNNAMQKLHGLIESKSGGLDEIIEVLVKDAFRVDQVGYVDVKKVLDLRRHKISDPIWVAAMQDIAESIQIVGSTSYLQFYFRETPESDWQSIPLDIARV